MKKYRVTISDNVFAEVERYLNHISEDHADPVNAERWWDKAVEKIFSLEQLPNRYPLCSRK